MDSILNYVLTTSLYASIVGIIIIIVKVALNKKMNAALHYLIWIVLLLKLIVPFGPEAVFSLYNLVPQIPTDKIEISNKMPPQKDSSINYESQAINSSSVQHETKPTVVVARKVNKLPYLWLAGAILMLVWFLYSYYSLNKKLRKSILINNENLNYILEDSKARLNIKRNISLVLQEEINSPSLFGVFRPRILLSKEIINLKDTQIKYIFLHELAHYKRKDVVITHILLLFQIIHWFNPILWYCFKCMREDMETATDEKVLSILDDNEHREYGRALLIVLESFNPSRNALKLIGMANNKKNIEKRIRLIKESINFKRRKPVIMIIGILIIVILGGIALTNGITKKFNASDSGLYNAKALLKYKTAYIGNASKVSGIVNNLPYAKLSKGISIKTDSLPYVLTVNYDFTESNFDITNVEYALRSNSYVLFSLINNVDNIIFEIKGYSELSKLEFTRTEVKKYFSNDLTEYSKSLEKFIGFLNSFNLKLQVGPEKYSMAMSSTPGIRISAEYSAGADKVRFSATSGAFETWDVTNGYISPQGKTVDLPITVPVYWYPENFKDKNITVTVIVLDKQGKKLGEKQVNITYDDSMFYTVQPAQGIVIGSKKYDTASKGQIDKLVFNVLSDKHIVPQKGISSQKAREVIISKLKADNNAIANQMNRETIEEITTQEAWENIGVQLFSLKYDLSIDAIAIVKNGKCVGIMSGMPIFDVYLWDLNNDGILDVCVNAHFGSGIVDARVIACDVAASKIYELADRGKKDLYLRISNDTLVVDTVPYMAARANVETTGKLILMQNELKITN